MKQKENNGDSAVVSSFLERRSQGFCSFGGSNLSNDKQNNVDIFHQALIDGELSIVRDLIEKQKFSKDFRFNQRYHNSKAHLRALVEESMTPLHICYLL